MGIVSLFIGNSECYSVKSDWLFITQSRGLQADRLILIYIEKATLNIKRAQFYQPGQLNLVNKMTLPLFQVVCWVFFLLE